MIWQKKSPKKVARSWYRRAREAEDLVKAEMEERQERVRQQLARIRALDAAARRGGAGA